MTLHQHLMSVDDRPMTRGLRGATKMG